jgi:hypothetical protein
MNTNSLAQHLKTFHTDAAIAASEECYAALFRSLEVEIADEDLVSLLNDHALEKATVGFSEARFEMFVDTFKPPFKVGDRVVMLVNYKGEGERYVHAEAAADLPLFRSKHASFVHFGA